MRFVPSRQKTGKTSNSLRRTIPKRTTIRPKNCSPALNGEGLVTVLNEKVFYATRSYLLCAPRSRMDVLTPSGTGRDRASITACGAYNESVDREERLENPEGKFDRQADQESAAEDQPAQQKSRKNLLAAGSSTASSRRRRIRLSKQLHGN